MSATFKDESNAVDIFPNRGLSGREQEVAFEIARGLTNKEAAENLFVTEKTIKFHLTNIYRKIRVKTRAQLIVMAIQENLFAVAPAEPEAVVAPPAVEVPGLPEGVK